VVIDLEIHHQLLSRGGGTTHKTDPVEAVVFDNGSAFWASACSIQNPKSSAGVTTFQVPLIFLLGQSLD